jgi:hypothetical protein
MQCVLNNLLCAVPKMQMKIVELDSIELLKAICEHSTIFLVGKFVYDVVEIFYATPVHGR